MHRFWCPEDLQAGLEIVLSDDESHHLFHVLRLREGERVALVNGRGALGLGEIVKASAKATRVRLDSAEICAPRSKLRVCFGVPKPAALEFLLRRCTEIGVAAFQPLVTQHSLPASGWNERRWQKILHEVGKQCEERHFPALEPPLKLAAFLESRDPARQLVLCDEGAREAPLTETSSAGVDLLVGAEGGWSRDEVHTFSERGAKLLGLGQNRLRAEMAALVGTVLLKKLMGELS